MTQNMKMLVVQVETKTVVKSFTMELYSLVAESGRINRPFDEENIH